MILHDNKIRSQTKGQQQLVMWQQSQKATYSLAGGEQVTHFPQGWGFQLTVIFRHKLSHASGQSASGVCIPAPFPVPALEPSVKSYYQILGYNFTSKLNTQVQALARDSPCCPCCFFASMLTGQHTVGDSMEQLLLGSADEDRLLQQGREFQQCMCTHVYVIQLYFGYMYVWVTAASKSPASLSAIISVRHHW